MKQGILILVFLSPILTYAKAIKASEVFWLPRLAEKDVREFHVCGDSEIQPTKKSLSRHFALGSRKTGFLFSNLISYRQYVALLSEKTSEEAKSALRVEFSQTHLWRYSKENGFEDLGAPGKVDLPFSASIKDCMEGAKTTLGADCSRYEERRGCCGEKFVGPVLFWGDKEEYKLMYNPDPSVRLRVAGEKKHRYCNVQEAVTISTP